MTLTQCDYVWRVLARHVCSRVYLRRPIKSTPHTQTHSIMYAIRSPIKNRRPNPSHASHVRHRTWPLRLATSRHPQDIVTIPRSQSSVTSTPVRASARGDARRVRRPPANQGRRRRTLHNEPLNNNNNIRKHKPGPHEGQHAERGTRDEGARSVHHQLLDSKCTSIIAASAKK